MTEAESTILLVDDDEVDREMVARLLQSEVALVEASGGQAALDLLETVRPDCILLDYRLPDADGLDLLAAFDARQLPTVMLTGEGSQAIAVEAMKRGAGDYITKDGLNRESLLRAITNSIEKRKLQLKISEQQAHLRSNEALLNQVMAGMPVGLCVVDAGGSFIHMNEAAKEMFELSESPPTEHAGEFFTQRLGRHEEAQESPEKEGSEDLPVTHALYGNKGSTEEVLIKTSRGLRPALMSAEPIRSESGQVLRAVVTLQDITEQKQVARQLQMAQRMEAVGQLAGGVAHDFNNLLTAIYSYSTFVAQDLEPGSSNAEDMQEIIRATKRAEALTRQLLAFSRRQTVRPKVLDVNDVLRDIEKLVVRLLETHRYQLDLSPDIGHVRIDPGALEQIVVNLVVNARDAMEPGGEVQVETNTVFVDGSYGASHEVQVPPGNYVMLAVSDSGSGIDTKIQHQIFEPFFTTKEAGKGTGLGLATCYGLVKQAHGFIWVYSEPDLGTTFKILLPAVDEPVQASRERSETGKLSGSETILVAEDNDQIRKLAERVLRRYGYTVFTATDGRDALRALDSDMHPDLLLTDVIMPEMNGKDLATHAQMSRPDLKVLFMSGYAPQAILRHGITDDSMRFLQKPFTPGQLARRVRQLLDQSQSP